MHIWHITKRFILQQIHELIVKQKYVCEHHAEISPIQTVQAIINSIFQHTTFPKKKEKSFAVYICGVSYTLKKAVYTAQFLSYTPTLNTFKSCTFTHSQKHLWRGKKIRFGPKQPVDQRAAISDSYSWDPGSIRYQTCNLEKHEASVSMSNPCNDCKVNGSFFSSDQLLLTRSQLDDKNNQIMI